jgi:hypothetical protein
MRAFLRKSTRFSPWPRDATRERGSPSTTPAITTGRLFAETLGEFGHRHSIRTTPPATMEDKLQVVVYDANSSRAETADDLGVL